MSAATIDEKVREEIETLRKIELKAFGAHHGRTDFYEYLDAVLALYGDWKRHNRIKKRIARVTRLYKIKIRKNTHPLRVIIDASTKQKPDVKSEWTRALRYVERHRGTAERIGCRNFLQENGGPAGCAAKIAKSGAIRREVRTGS